MVIRIVKAEVWLSLQRPNLQFLSNNKFQPAGAVKNRFPLYFLHKTINIYNEQKWCLFGLIRLFYFLGNFF